MYPSICNLNIVAIFILVKNKIKKAVTMSSIANSTGSAKKSIPNVESQPMLNVAPILQMDGAEAARIVGTAVTDNPS